MALIALVVVSLAVTVATSRASIEARREREMQLLWVGNQYRQALRHYAATIPVNGPTQYPLELADLLDDHRAPLPLRHLRQLYPDPMTGKLDWVLEMQGGRIVGLHSSSEGVPIRHAGFGAEGDASFASAKTYEGWRFLATNLSLPVASGAPAVTVGGGAVDSGGSGDVSAGPGGEPSPPAISNSAVACYNQYVVPRGQCNSASPPMGNDTRSCQTAMIQAYTQCMAAAGGN